MIEEVVHILQRIACLWLALSVIYPVANAKIMESAHRNNPRDQYRPPESAKFARLMQPALATLALTIADMLLSVF